jgi:glycosyltransferase involved in cell wall biosynthesis
LCTHQIGGLIVASRNNYEAFGLTAVEAVALGRLAVVRRTGGLNEIARSLELFSADNDLDLINLAQVLLLRSDLNLVISNQQEKLMHFYSRSSFTQRLKSLVQTDA